MESPFLIGENFYLRPITANDLTNKYQQWFNDVEVCQFNSHHRFPNYRQNMEEYYESAIKSRNNLVLAIVDKKTDSHIGNISLQDIDGINRCAELAIIVGDKNYWNRGAGSEACKLIVDHGFKQLNLHRIYFGTSELNIGMQKLGEKLGFKKDGVLRDALFKNGKFSSINYYSLLEDEK